QHGTGLLVVSDQQPLGTQALRGAVVVRPLQHRADGGAQDLHLLPGDLLPAAVIADQPNDGHLVTGEWIPLRQRVAHPAIPVEGPHLGAGWAQLGRQREASARPQGAEYAWVEPR